MARKEKLEDHLAQVLVTKPAEVVQEACRVLKKHNISVKKELQSELCRDCGECLYTIIQCIVALAFYRATWQLESARTTGYTPHGINRSFT